MVELALAPLFVDENQPLVGTGLAGGSEDGDEIMKMLVPFPFMRFK